MNASIDVLTLFLFNIVLVNIPLLYGTVGEIVTEKAGSLNLGVEGTMAIGAIFGYLAGCMANSLLVGLLGLLSGRRPVRGPVCPAHRLPPGQPERHRPDHHHLRPGPLLLHRQGPGGPLARHDKRRRPGQRLLRPGDPLLSSIPVVGKALFSHNILVYLGILVAAAVWWYLTCTKTGLRLRSVGENPGAADSVGVNILLYKYVHLILGSGIMGLGGFYMALNMGGSFEGSNCWINGYGWIAIALVIFANWNPLYAILGTLVFGFFNTLQIYSGSLAGAFPDALGWLNSIPSHLFKALPFLITAIVLVVTSIRKREGSGQPAALGLNYFREER